MTEKAIGAIAANIDVARGRAAERTRKSRNRRHKGLRCFPCELRESEIEALVLRGLLAPDEVTNRAAVLKAMYSFLERAFGGGT